MNGLERSSTALTPSCSKTALPWSAARGPPLAPAALAGDGYSPLMSAAMAGSTKGVYALLRRGARRDAVAHDGMTALLLAVLKEQIATVTALVHAGASLFKKVRQTTEVVPAAVAGINQR